jgi:hypothetical protein
MTSGVATEPSLGFVELVELRNPACASRAPLLRCANGSTQAARSQSRNCFSAGDIRINHKFEDG